MGRHSPANPIYDRGPSGTFKESIRQSAVPVIPMKTFTKSLLFAVAAAAAVAINAAPLESGKPAPDFTLTDINGKTHKLSDYNGKIVVLEWVNPECPVVVGHYRAKNMQETQKAAAADGAVWLQINSGHPGAQGDYDQTAATEWQKKQGVTATAYLRDQSGKVGRLYGATNTPHMYVINKDGTLVYQGAIDSNARDMANATNYVKAALAAIKTGKPVEKAATKAYGCGIKYGRDT